MIAGHGTLRALLLGAMLAPLLPSCLDGWTRRGQRAVVEIRSLSTTPKGDDLATITETDYRLELARIRYVREGNMNAGMLPSELKRQILARLVDRRLLMLEAIRKGVRASTTSIERELAGIRRGLPDKEFERELIRTYQTERDLALAIEERLTTALLLKQEALALVRVTEEDAGKLWENMPESERVRPARVHAAQIVLPTEDEGRRAIAELERGRDFGDLARERSVAPERIHGGDLGWFEPGVMPSVFDDVCFSLRAGEVSGLTPSEYGFHIFKVLETEEERALTYETARPQLLSRLREERIRSAEAEYLEQLRSRVRIVRNEALIASID